MGDPRYMECWGPYLTDSFTAETQFTYVNLIVAHWYAEYDVGEMPDALLRATAVSVFASGPGRHYWETTGTFWRDNYPGRRARRFHRVLEDTYQEAIRTPVVPPPAAPPEPVRQARADQPRSRHAWATSLAAAGGGAAAALVVVRLLRRVLRR